MVCVCPAGVERVESSLCRDEVEDMGKDMVEEYQDICSIIYLAQYGKSKGSRISNRG